MINVNGDEQNLKLLDDLWVDVAGLFQVLSGKMYSVCSENAGHQVSLVFKGASCISRLHFKFFFLYMIIF